MELANTTMNAILIIGHGSRHSQANHEFVQLVESIRGCYPQQLVEYAYLELSEPDIQHGIDRCVERGARSVMAVPALLLAAGHIKTDIPKELAKARQRYPQLDIRYASHLHLHHAIVTLCTQRIEEWLARFQGTDRSRIHLIVVGRGTEDLDANSDVAKLMRILWEEFGFGWGSVAFLAATEPRLERSLQQAVLLPYSTILVFPFVLFQGYLYTKVQSIIQRFADSHPGWNVGLVEYLNADPLVAQAMRDRIDRAMVARDKADEKHVCD